MEIGKKREGYSMQWIHVDQYRDEWQTVNTLQKI